MNKQEQITKRREQTPNRCKGFYDKAMRGRSLKMAVKAFCLECVCWQKEEIKNCTDVACPLYPYKPYQEIPWKARKGIKSDVHVCFRRKTQPNAG